jgi:hypothetical protein
MLFIALFVNQTQKSYSRTIHSLEIHSQLLLLDIFTAIALLAARHLLAHSGLQHR